MIITFYPDELDYCNAHLHQNAESLSFLTTFCLVCLRADDDNYELLRPVLKKLMEKYPAKPKRLAMERIDSGRARPGDRELVTGESEK